MIIIVIRSIFPNATIIFESITSHADLTYLLFIIELLTVWIFNIAISFLVHVCSSHTLFTLILVPFFAERVRCFPFALIPFKNTLTITLPSNKNILLETSSTSSELITRGAQRSIFKTCSFYTEEITCVTTFAFPLRIIKLTAIGILGSFQDESIILASTYLHGCCCQQGHDQQSHLYVQIYLPRNSKYYHRYRTFTIQKTIIISEFDDYSIINILLASHKLLFSIFQYFVVLISAINSIV